MDGLCLSVKRADVEGLDVTGREQSATAKSMGPWGSGHTRLLSSQKYEDGNGGVRKKGAIEGTLREENARWAGGAAEEEGPKKGEVS